MIDDGTKELLSQINAKRRELAISQAVLAGWLGVSRNMISRWFRFKHVPRDDHIQQMLDCLRECEEGKRQYTPSIIVRKCLSPKVPDAAVDYLYARVKRHWGLMAKISRRLGITPKLLTHKMTGAASLREYEAAVILEMLKESRHAGS